MKAKIEQLKKSIIVFDIETSAKFPEGELIDIAENFDEYVKFAKVKWIGMYSYLHDEYVLKEVKGNEELIKDYIGQHNILVGFNSEEFDTPIMYNNDLMPENKRFTQVDCRTILGPSNSYLRNGAAFKNRGKLMGFKYKRNSLKCMAETMKVETQKGDIDYNIFLKTSWSDEERAEILKYLEADVKATKEIFDLMWDFWMPFTDFISEKNVMNLSWIRSSIASLRYKGDCHTLGVEETYGEKDENAEKEEMGGNVIEPIYEEARNVWYLDFSSLYPWIRNMFCIDNEVINPEKWTGLRQNLFHGNGMFETKGYYDISYQSAIAQKSVKNLITRTDLKKNDPDNPLIYAIKIYENAGYGALRSPVFEQIHTPNAGWDICWLGQQMQEYVKQRMLHYGLETIAGDTDSVFVKSIDSSIVSKEFMDNCLSIIIKEILANVPYPNDAFSIEIEYDTSIEYIMWPFSMEAIVGPDGTNIKNDKGRLIKQLKGKKKNYVYLFEKNGELKVKFKGLSIIKDNATPLGRQILDETLTPIILESRQAKFSSAELSRITHDWLMKPGAIRGLAREFKCKRADTYKPSKDGTPSNNIYAQISRGYFGGQSGVVSLIKNKKYGRAGKTSLYCTAEEAEQNNLQMKDIDLTKLENELSPFRRND